LSPELLCDTRRSYSKAVLGGSLLAFALLAHGSTAFSILGLALLVFFFRSRLIWSKGIWVSLLSCFFLYLPWTLYQKFYDPPGDRLLKWHLAGVTRATPVPFGKTLAKAYSELSVEQIIDYKVRNLDTVINGQAAYWSGVETMLTHLGTHDAKDAALLEQTAEGLRALCFFQTAPCLGLLMWGPVALLAGTKQRLRSREWKAAAVLYLYVGFTVVAWCILSFGPGTTIIHQGSYTLMLLAFTASTLSFWVVSPLLATVIALLQIALNVLFYGIFMREPPAGGTISQQSLHGGMFALFCCSVILPVSLLRRARGLAPTHSISTECGCEEKNTRGE
jgi:4-amino-4-deoxy-L-arabinose transferase-like glycosyltransferase